MNLEQLNSLTLYGRSVLLESGDERLWQLGLDRKQVENSIECFFDQDSLASAVREGRESYTSLAEYVAGYIRTQKSLFPFQSACSPQRDQQTIRLVSSLRNVGIKPLADPRGYTGSTRERQQYILTRFAALGGGMSGMFYFAADSQGGNPVLSTILAGSIFTSLGLKMMYDALHFLDEGAREIPQVAQESEVLVKKFV